MLEIIKNQTINEDRKNYIGWSQVEVPCGCSYTSLREFYLVYENGELKGYKTFNYKFTENDGHDLRKDFRYINGVKTNVVHYDFQSEKEKEMFIELSKRDSDLKEKQSIIL